MRFAVVHAAEQEAQPHALAGPGIQIELQVLPGVIVARERRRARHERVGGGLDAHRVGVAATRRQHDPGGIFLALDLDPSSIDGKVAGGLARVHPRPYASPGPRIDRVPVGAQRRCDAERIVAARTVAAQPGILPARRVVPALGAVPCVGLWQDEGSMLPTALIVLEAFLEIRDDAQPQTAALRKTRHVARLRVVDRRNPVVDDVTRHAADVGKARQVRVRVLSVARQSHHRAGLTVEAILDVRVRHVRVVLDLDVQIRWPRKCGDGVSCHVRDARW